MPSEFELIRCCFTHPVTHTDLGVGDDSALFHTQPGMQLVVSTDMLISGTHFFTDAEPESLGWKTAAVNISDIAAMAAQPRWIVLAVALPQANDAWIDTFAQGFLACCQAFDVDWAGGDTTRGPLSLCATVFGEVPHGQAICRSGARAGDDLWISGQPGLAALGLQYLLGNVTLNANWIERCLNALHRPQPRVQLGLALRGLATAMLDVSDGLLGDLKHLLERSRCGVMLEDKQIPLSIPFAACADMSMARSAVLSGGDDYELLFTAPQSRREEVQALSTTLQIPLTRLGSMTHKAGSIWSVMADGTTEQTMPKGYDHFVKT